MHQTVRIGIIGAGKMGSALAGLFANAGHKVIICNSRGPDSLSNIVARLGPLVSAATLATTVERSDVIILCTPWRKPEALPSPELVAGKIVIDAMNPYNEDESVIDLGESTSSEETAKRLPGCRLVKAFNTIWYRDLLENGRPFDLMVQRQAIFVAGDHPAANELVEMLIEDIGFSPIVIGGLREGGILQGVESPLFNEPMTAGAAENALQRLRQK